MEDIKEKLTAYAPAIVVLIVVVVLLIWYANSERFVNRTVNMIGWRHPDPAYYKYNNRNKQPNGMDLNDYYVENKMTHAYGVGPELINEAAFDSRIASEDTLLKEEPVGAPDSMDLAPHTEKFVGGFSY